MTDSDTDLLDMIYDGSVDAVRWQSLLGDVMRRLGGVFGVACRGFDDDGVPVDRMVIGNAGLDRTGEAFTLLREKVTPVNRSWSDMGQQDDLSFAALMSNRKDGHRFLFGADAGAMGHDAGVWLDKYGHHLLRAARLRADVERALQQARDALALLDMLHVPVMLVDEQLHVIVANGAVRTLEKEGLLRLSNRELRFASAPAMERVRNAVAGIANGTASGADMFVRLDLSDGNSFLAMIEPLEGVFMDAEKAPSSAVAAILLKNPERTTLPTEAALRELHEMPPAEARLAAAMAEGLTIKDYSQREGLSETYIRDLSKQVMGRLGVNRQPDLVRAILSLASDFTRHKEPRRGG